MPNFALLLLLLIFSVRCFLLLIMLTESITRLVDRAVLSFTKAHFTWPIGSMFHFQDQEHLATAQKCSSTELSITQYKNTSCNASDEYDEQVDCVFCLSGIQEGQEVRELRCRHVFHRTCLDKWLVRPRATCPLCRDRLGMSVPPEAKEQYYWDEVGEYELSDELGIGLLAYVCSNR